MPYGGGADARRCVVIAAVLIGAFWFFGATMTAQFSDLIARLPGAWAGAAGAPRRSRRSARSCSPACARIRAQQCQHRRLADQRHLDRRRHPVGAGGGHHRRPLPRGAAAACTAAGWSGWCRGNGQQQETIATFDAIAAALRGWLKGQALGMIFVGVGDRPSDSPSSGCRRRLAIGLVAGLAEFVPYLGTVVAVIPAVILGFSQGTDTGPVDDRGDAGRPAGAGQPGHAAAAEVDGRPAAGADHLRADRGRHPVRARRRAAGDAADRSGAGAGAPPVPRTTTTPLGGDSEWTTAAEPALDLSPAAPPRKARSRPRSTRSGSPSPR